jgi:very-short-patch-repair endonuclease
MPVSTPRFQLEVVSTPRTNLAMQQNGVPLVRSVRVRNVEEVAWRKLVLRVVADPACVAPWSLTIDGLRPGATHAVEPVPMLLSSTFLARQAESEVGTLTVGVTIDEDDEVLTTFPLEVMAPTAWMGMSVLPELLAAFVRPNAAVLAPLLKDAAERLRASTGDASLSGYQSRDPKRVWRTAAALYEAVQARGTSYISPPASFEVTGQKVRTHEQVIDGGQGTCLDLTVLLAALLEQTGLHPVLVVVQGHAFPGVWLTDFALQEPTLDDPLPLRKRVELGEALVFDSSSVAQGAPFERAVATAERALLDVERFRMVLDVTCARSNRVRPLPLESAGDALADALQAAPDLRLGVAPSVVPEDRFRFSDAAPKGVTALTRTRVDAWKQRLLDLSLHNRLLNFRPGKATLELPGVDVHALEDALVDGRALELAPKLTPRAADPRDPAADGVPADVLAEARAREAQAAGRLHSSQPPAEHERALLELFRTSRSAFEESGAVLLYVALGMLVWFESASSTQPRKAPLVLVPVQLKRGRAPGSWTLTRADEDTRVNVTLLQKLQKDFGVDVSGLDVLEEDGSGFDIARVLHDFRARIRDRDRWLVVEEAHLGLFSFHKFLMWLDLEAKTEALLQNPVVKHLFEGGGGAYPLAAPLVVPGDVDQARAPKDMLTVVDADPSQLSAILAAEDGSSFVLQGPPGTGKSQTITNLIAQLLAANKTVLFVSEKLAALEVVQRRLAKVGLAPFCLELHSNQANKAAVMAQLKASFEVGATRSGDAWKEHCAKLEATRTQLNAHAARLAAPSPFGVATREVLASLFGMTDVPRLTLPAVDMRALAPSDVAARAAAARAVAVAVGQVGDLATHPFRGVGRSDWDPTWARQVDEAARALAEAARVVEAKVPAALAATGLPADTDLATLAEAATLLLESPAPPPALIALTGFSERASRLRGWIARGRALTARRTALLETWQDAILTVDLAALRERFGAWAHAFFVFAFVMLWGARRRLRALARAALPTNDAILHSLDEATFVRDETAALAAVGQDGRAWLGERWQDAATPWDAAEQVIGWAERYQAFLLRLVDRRGDTAEAARLTTLATDQAALLRPGARTHAALSELVGAAASMSEARRAAVSLLGLDEAVAWGAEPTPARVAEAAEGWLASGTLLRAWCDVVDAVADASRLGLRPLVDGITSGTVRHAHIERSVDRSLREGWWESLLQREPALARFRGATHADLIERFRELDRKAIELARAEVRARLAARVPDANAPGDEMALLRRQLLMQRRHMPIRQLFTKIPTTLKRAKPCVLMSPLSVAQYLDPSLEGFDVVVFDEASQIPPWDAVGAIARGRQVVVVGDSKQLPPTSFFGRSADEEGEEPDDESRVEMESILDEAVGAGLTQLLLQWHYRSQHESLIAFSNVHYYESRLHTFPSAAADVPELGVKLVKVDGFYDRGGSRTNEAEAAAVVDELIRLLQLPDDLRPSVGVVTFSMTQQRCVQDLLDARLRTLPDLQRHFTDAVPEKVFVKNLENVQGDERDVMLFSVCYGPDKAGKLTMNFGPLNRKGGERRLNVAVTRARQRLVLFSTLSWDRIPDHGTAAVGVAHLKAYLRFAEQGEAALLATTAAPDRDTFMSPFEEQVFRALTDAGHLVHTQVGCSGYKIDLAIVDPARPGTYLLGIECDGATYHGSRAARERDRLREDVLVTLGWRIHRIWSTDWWYERDAAMKRVVDAIEVAKRAPALAPRLALPALEPTHVADAAPSLEERLAAPAAVSWPSDATPWRGLGLAPVAGGREVFYEVHARPRLAVALLQLVQAHGPVHRDAAYRIVAGAWGLGALGKRIVAQLDASLLVLTADQRPIARGDFLWPQGLDPRAWRAFRYPAEGSRDLDTVCPEEVANAAAWVLSRGLSMSQDDLVRETARVFGLAGVTAKARARFAEAVPVLVATGRAALDGERLRSLG